MPSNFEIQLVINYIKRLSQHQRQAYLKQLLTDFPNDWLWEAIAIANGIADNRGVDSSKPLPSLPKPITPNPYTRRF